MLVKLAQVWAVLFISVYKYCPAFTMHALHIGTAMLISADDTGRGNCDCAVPSQLIESAPTFIEVDDNNEYFI